MVTKELLKSDSAALQLFVFYLFPMCSYQVPKGVPQVFLETKFPIAPQFYPILFGHSSTSMYIKYPNNYCVSMPISFIQRGKQALMWVTYLLDLSFNSEGHTQVFSFGNESLWLAHHKINSETLNTPTNRSLQCQNNNLFIYFLFTSFVPYKII